MHLDLVKKEAYPPRRIISRSVIIPKLTKTLMENKLSSSCPNLDSLEKDPRSCFEILSYQGQYLFHYEIARKYLDAMTLPIYFTTRSVRLYKKFGNETKQAGVYYRSLINQYKIKMSSFGILLDRVKLIDKHYLLLKHKQIKEKAKQANREHDVDKLYMFVKEAEDVRKKLEQRHEIMVKELLIYFNPSDTHIPQLSCFKKFSKTD